MQHLQGMKKEVKTELVRLKEEVMDRLETKEREITEVLQTLPNTSCVQPSQQPPGEPVISFIFVPFIVGSHT